MKIPLKMPKNKVNKKKIRKERKKSVNLPPEFFLAISSALDVLRWSIRKLGILNGGIAFILSVEYWCLKVRWRSGDDIDMFSIFKRLRCCRSIFSKKACIALKIYKRNMIKIRVKQSELSRHVVNIVQITTCRKYSPNS